MDDKVIDKDEMRNLELPDELVQRCLDEGLFLDTGLKNDAGLPVYVMNEEAKQALLDLFDELEEEKIDGQNE